MSVVSKINKRNIPNKIEFIFAGVFVLLVLYLLLFTNLFSSVNDFVADIKIQPKKVLDFADYDQRMLVLATASSTALFQNNATGTVASTVTSKAENTATGTATSTIAKAKISPWPVKTVYPNAEAILPFKRVVAYYGNFLSTKMGVLGQYPADEMLSKLQVEVKKWEDADPTTAVMPAIDYIAVTAQGDAGDDNKYKLRMSDSEIDHALDLAGQINGIVFLEIQAGLSDLKTEIPLLEKYLKMPQVHLALDPEFYMKKGNRPGSVIGSMDASDVNFAANYLAKLVRENNLPPKILIVHRFTFAMVTNYVDITPLPEVQIVMDMDGWGSLARKNTTYSKIIAGEPVQFTGFKLFYKNDILPPSTRMMTPEEVLKLKPRPIFIQYQ